MTETDIAHELSQIKGEIENLNDNLLSDVKRIFGKTTYSLVKTEVSSRWGKFNRVVTTDFILEKFVELVISRDNDSSKKILDLEKIISCQQLRIANYIPAEQDPGKDFQVLSEELESLKDQLTQKGQEVRILTEERAELYRKLTKSNETVQTSLAELDVLRDKGRITGPRVSHRVANRGELRLASETAKPERNGSKNTTKYSKHA